MVDLPAYKDKFGISGQRVLEYALSESRRRDQNCVAVEHILDALMHEEPDMFNSTMRELSLDPIAVRLAVDKKLQTSRQQHLGKGFRITPDATDLFKRAVGEGTDRHCPQTVAMASDETVEGVGVTLEMGGEEAPVVRPAVIDHVTRTSEISARC